MFVDELTPLFKKFTQHPVSFLGGFFSGVLRLHLTEEPVKSWLDQQVGPDRTSSNTSTRPHNGAVSGPQSISID